MISHSYAGHVVCVTHTTVRGLALFHLAHTGLWMMRTTRQHRSTCRPVSGPKRVAVGAAGTGGHASMDTFPSVPRGQETTALRVASRTASGRRTRWGSWGMARVRLSSACRTWAWTTSRPLSTGPTTRGHTVVLRAARHAQTHTRTNCHSRGPNRTMHPFKQREMTRTVKQHI